MSRDPLAECLAIAARLHGDAVSPHALTAGLPLEAGRLTPELAPRAAERARLNTQWVTAPLSDLPTESGPAVLLLKDGGASLLVRREDDRAQVISPESPDAPREVALSELEADYSGEAPGGLLAGWRVTLDGDASLPRPALSSVRLYERAFYLSSANL